MGDKIHEYTETRIPFGNIPVDARVNPGEFWTMVDAGKVVAVTFLCPCGCGSECYTPVTDATAGGVKSERHWLYSAGPTLSPSIRYTGGCKAHFNIENGKTVFHGDSGQ